MVEYETVGLQFHNLPCAPKYLVACPRPQGGCTEVVSMSESCTRYSRSESNTRASVEDLKYHRFKTHQGVTPALEP